MFCFFFFIDTATTEIYTLSLHDALPILKDGVIHTPMLTGTILPGITRASIIDLARARGYEVIERKVPIKEVREAGEAFVLHGVLSAAWESAPVDGTGDAAQERLR